MAAIDKGLKISPYHSVVDDWIAWLEKQSERNKIEALRTEYEKGRADAIAEMSKE